MVVGIGISSPLKYLLDKEEAPAFHIQVKSYVKKVKRFGKSFVIFFVEKWHYWELFENIREHKTYQGKWRGKHKGRGKGRKVGKSKENLLLLPDTHTPVP